MDPLNKTKKCKQVLKKYPYLKETWKEIYNIRKQKVGSKKAIYSADAVTLSEALKFFSYKSKRKKVKIILEQKTYSSYSYKKFIVYLTKDKGLLNDFPNSKPISEVQENPFDAQVISEIIKKNKLNIDNSFFYYITENE